MATVSNPRDAFNRVDADRRVRHPLHAIRGYIRRYVLLEGIALTVLYLGLVFWIALLLDYGPWRLFSFDWLWQADELSGPQTTRLLRAVILVGVLVGLGAVVVFKVMRRLFKEFSDASVALLLEKRYPKQLGDRLITAVELADPTLAQKYGYSQTMVDHTIRDAAERVGQLPVHEIFRWNLLRFKWALALAATLGVYLLAAGAWCFWTGRAPMHFFTRFNQTGAILTERNVLLDSSYWPPNTMIELIRFPGTALGVPRDEERPEVKVRYVHWAIADNGTEAPRGWRALRFSDLAEVLGAEPIIDLPTDWGGWIIDMDDLDAEVPAGAVPPDWNWQLQSSGYIRKELTKQQVKDVLDRVAANKGKSTLTRDKLYSMLNWRHWTVDKIEIQLQYEDPKAKKLVVANALQAARPKAYGGGSRPSNEAPGGGRRADVGPDAPRNAQAVGSGHRAQDRHRQRLGPVQGGQGAALVTANSFDRSGRSRASSTSWPTITRRPGARLTWCRRRRSIRCTSTCRNRLTCSIAISTIPTC